MNLESILSFVTLPSCLVALTIVIVTAIIHFYYRKKYSFWSSKGIKQPPRPLPIVSNFFQMFVSKKPLQDIELENYLKYGRLYGIYRGTRPILVCAEPELVRQIMVKDFFVFPGRSGAFVVNEPLFENNMALMNGERWKAIRSIVTQTFTSGKMRRVAPLIHDCTDTFLRNIKEAADRNESIDCRLYLTAFTMDVIASCAFGTKIDTLKDPNNPIAKNARRVFDQHLSLKIIIGYVAPKLYEKLGFHLLDDDITEFFYGVIRRLIKARKEMKERRNDFLQLLLDSSEISNKPLSENDDLEEPDISLESIYEVEKNSSQLKLDSSTLKKRALTEDEVVAQCFMFFVAGHETTATTLSFAIYHLATKPEIQERLIQEIDAAFQKHGEFTYDVVLKMPYLNAFVSEILRLNNPGINLERMNEEDYTLGDTGIVIPKGTLVSVPTYAMHHDPEWFPEPFKFDPERFMPENKDNIIPYTYLPFGVGPRSCVALRFALMESKLFLCKVLREVKFSACSETKLSVRLLPAAQLFQPSGIIVKVEKR